MCLAFNSVNVETKLAKVWATFARSMVTSNKTQMVLNHNNSIIVSNGQHPPAHLWRQLGCLQWSSSIRLSAWFYISHKNVTLCYWLHWLIINFLASNFFIATIFNVYLITWHLSCTFSALMPLVGWLEGRPACKKTEGWGTGVVICLERGADDLHMVHLIPLPPHHLLLQ